MCESLQHLNRSLSYRNFSRISAVRAHVRYHCCSLDRASLREIRPRRSSSCGSYSRRIRDTTYFNRYWIEYAILDKYRGSRNEYNFVVFQWDWSKFIVRFMSYRCASNFPQLMGILAVCNTYLVDVMQDRSAEVIAVNKYANHTSVRLTHIIFYQLLAVYRFCGCFRGRLTSDPGHWHRTYQCHCNGLCASWLWADMCDNQIW